MQQAELTDNETGGGGRPRYSSGPIMRMDTYVDELDEAKGTGAFNGHDSSTCEDATASPLSLSHSALLLSGHLDALTCIYT